MKRFLFVCVIFMASIAVGAKTLVFTLADGTKVYYTLNALTDGLRYAPVVKFSQGNVTVNGDQYEWSGIKEFYLSDESDPAGILPHALCVETDAQVVVYSADGKKMMEAESLSAFKRIDMSGLPKGVYVVIVDGKNGGKESFKVTKN
ncbi:MAG: T9SS type A sorting domain-containing protein [Prevotella sp.]|nr:T9SS type A sorting domain-containing protein [Prevotella sp.]